MKRNPTNVELFDIAQSNSEHSRLVSQDQSVSSANLSSSMLAYNMLGVNHCIAESSSKPWLCFRVHRHWFFKGDIVIDGQKMPNNLMNIIGEPLKKNPNNSVVAFKDNSSALRGTLIKQVLPSNPGMPSPIIPQDRDWDLLLTAETHNFPSAVAPYPGEDIIRNRSKLIV